jgi:hypothetical protein
MERKFDEAAMEAIENILEREKPFDKIGEHVYSRLIAGAFEKIRFLRGKGFSFVQIFNAFEKAGLLPKNPKYKCFIQAFQREKERRSKADDLLNLLENNHDTEKKEVSPIAAKRIREIGNRKKSEPRMPEPDEKAREQERIKELTGTLVDTGNGIIRKLPNGSFEF